VDCYAAEDHEGHDGLDGGGEELDLVLRRVVCVRELFDGEGGDEDGADANGAEVACKVGLGCVGVSDRRLKRT